MSSKVGFSLGGGVGKKRKLESAVVRSSGGEQEGEGSPKRDAVVAVSAGGVESTATDDCGPLVIPLAQDPWQSVRAAADAEELADKRQRSEDELAADALLADLHGAETGAKRTKSMRNKWTRLLETSNTAKNKRFGDLRSETLAALRQLESPCTAYLNSLAGRQVQQHRRRRRHD